MSKSKKKLQEQANPLANIGSVIRQKKVEDSSLQRIQQRRATPEKITIMLYEDQVEWIDSLLKDARKDGGKRLRRPEVVRPMLDFFRSIELDLRGVQNEQDVIGRIEEALLEQSESKQTP